MSFLKKRFYVGIFLILTLALWSLPATALADSGGATVAVTAGALTEVGDFSAAKLSASLNGADVFTEYPLNILVTDATGSGAGWNLQISGTALSDGSGHSLFQEDFPQSAGCVAGSACTAPNATFSFPVISSTPQRFFSVAANSGMGSIAVQNEIGVFIPGNAFAGTYTTTLTLAVAKGP